MLKSIAAVLAVAALALPDAREEASRWLAEWWLAGMADSAVRKAAGGNGRVVVERGLGAARRTAKLLAELISSRPLRMSPTGARSGPA